MPDVTGYTECKCCGHVVLGEAFCVYCQDAGCTGFEPACLCPVCSCSPPDCVCEAPSSPADARSPSAPAPATPTVLAPPSEAPGHSQKEKKP